MIQQIQLKTEPAKRFYVRNILARKEKMGRGGFQKKGCLNFQIAHPLSIEKKNSFSENVGKLFSKTFMLESVMQLHLQAFLVCESSLSLKGSRLFQTCQRLMHTVRSLIDRKVEQQVCSEKRSNTNSRGIGIVGVQIGKN